MKKSFWQELILQAIAPFMALTGVIISVRPDVLGPKSPDICQQVMRKVEVAPSGNIVKPFDFEMTGDDRSPPIEIINSFDISIAHIGLAVAVCILIVQAIRLYLNYKKA